MIERIDVIDEGTPEDACRAGKASASRIIRACGKEAVAAAYRDPEEWGKTREDALKSHGVNWDGEGDLGSEFLRCFDERIAQSLKESRRGTGTASRKA